MAGTDGIAVDALRGDPLATATFQRLIDAHKERPGRHEGGDQQGQQHPADGQPGPLSAAEHAMVAVKLPHLSVPGHPQGGGNGALRRSQERPHQQHLRVAPHARGKQRREGGHDGYHRGG